MTELRKRMIESLQLRGLSERTQEAYVRAVRQLAQHYKKSPDLVTEEELRQYFLYIKNVNKYARPTTTIALRFSDCTALGIGRSTAAGCRAPICGHVPSLGPVLQNCNCPVAEFWRTSLGWSSAIARIAGPAPSSAFRLPSVRRAMFIGATGEFLRAPLGGECQPTNGCMWKTNMALLLSTHGREPCCGILGEAIRGCP
jgi:Phage integrase, N-terminal SAM-like domain